MKNTSRTQGFTIIETLVAISILMLALTGPLLIISQALKASYYSRDQITAFYLAQEAVEYIRNVRDETSLSPDRLDTEWLRGIVKADCASNTEGTCVNKYDGLLSYKFNILHTGSSYTFERCDTAGCSPLTYDGTLVGNALPYGGGGSDNSIFSRSIWLTTVPGDDIDGADSASIPQREIVIHVEVKWKQGTADHQFVLESHLLNWKLEK